jgi:beta-glucosidase
MHFSKLVPGEWGSLASETQRSPEQIEAEAKAILAELSLDEKIRQMSGDEPFLLGLYSLAVAYNRYPIPAGENLRLKIPGIRFSDGPRGVVMDHATCFPVSMGRAATWDPALEEQVGDAMGVEARSLGANFFAGVCINLLRHPAWGRAQETYGEDPFLLGAMGSALVRGVQRHIMACVKHFALNSIENSRMKVNVKVSERTLREVYLPHFKRCIEAGAAAVMSAYNQVNGEYCGQNPHLLRDILKNEWGFDGFVVSDFFTGIYDAKKAALAGLDIEMPLQYHYWRDLKRLVEAGEVPPGAIDEAVLRILRQKLRFAQVGEPGRYRPQAVFSPGHRQLARRVAQESIVLLKNDPPRGSPPLLPLDLTRLQRLAVIGELAGDTPTGDHGSSRVRSPEVVSILEGLVAALGKRRVAYSRGWSLAEAQRVAENSDAAVVCVGYTYKDEGEKIAGSGGDRPSLAIHQIDEALIRAVRSRNQNTIVVLIGGSAIITESWRGIIPAILVAWYPGCEGGHAVADVLTGRVNPSGKLPCTFPRSPRQLPFFYPAGALAQTARTGALAQIARTGAGRRRDPAAREIEYGYYHGYRLMDQTGETPAFPFGFGLSYTTYAYQNLRLAQGRLSRQDTLLVRVDVTNTGSRPGEEVAQLYIGYPGRGVDRPRRELKGFARLSLAPGETKTAEIAVLVSELAYYDEAAAAWVVEEGDYVAYAGPWAREEELLRVGFEVA